MTGRGLNGRRQARRILLTAIALDVLLALLFLMQPHTMFDSTSAPPDVPLEPITLAPGIILNLVGLAWMVRILRANPEGGRPSWRAFRHR
jgi:hypothetical protein